jgi:hypothetical protein
MLGYLTYDILVQCTCVNYGINKEIVEIFKKIYPNGIKCNKCDSTQFERIEKASGIKIKRIDHSEFLIKNIKSFSKKKFEIDSN